MLSWYRMTFLLWQQRDLSAAVQTVSVDMWYASGRNVLRRLVIIKIISIILIVSMQLFMWYLFL